MAYYKAFSEINKLYARVPIIWDQVKKDYPASSMGKEEEWMLKTASALILADDERIPNSFAKRYVILRVLKLSEWASTQEMYRTSSIKGSSLPSFPQFDMFDTLQQLYVKIELVDNELFGLTTNEDIFYLKTILPEMQEFINLVKVYGCFVVIVNKRNGTVTSVICDEGEAKFLGTSSTEFQFFPTGVTQLGPVLHHRLNLLKTLNLEEFPERREESFVGMPSFVLDKFRDMNLSFEDPDHSETDFLGMKELDPNYQEISDKINRRREELEMRTSSSLESAETLQEYYEAIKEENEYQRFRSMMIPFTTETTVYPLDKMNFSYYKGNPSMLTTELVNSWINEFYENNNDFPEPTIWTAKMVPYPIAKFTKIKNRSPKEDDVREFFSNLTGEYTMFNKADAKESDLEAFLNAIGELKVRPYNVMNCNEIFPDENHPISKALGLGRKKIPSRKGLILSPVIEEMEKMEEGKPRPFRGRSNWEIPLVKMVSVPIKDQLFSADLIEFDSESKHLYDNISKELYTSIMKPLLKNGVMKNIVMWQRMYRNMAGMITEAQFSNVERKKSGKKQKKDKSSWFLTFPITTNFHQERQIVEFSTTPSTSSGKRKLNQDSSEMELDLTFTVDMSGVILRGQNHSKMQSDKVPIFTIQEVDPEYLTFCLKTKHTMWKKWNLIAMETTDEENPKRWFLFKRNSYKKVDPSFFAFPNINIIESINTFGNERLFLTQGRIQDIAQEVPEETKKEIIASISWQFIQSILMDNFDQGLFPFIRYLFLTEVASLVNERTFVLDIEEFKTKFMREYKSSNFAKTYLDYVINLVHPSMVRLE